MTVAFAFNDVLHALRDAELRQLPSGVDFLSAGCSGQWYFDWVDACCAPAKHVGVELYSPKPDALKSHCQWIASSIAAFPQVENASIDVVFSGQNIEHLWPDDIVGFLLEARRVLRPGGLLVVDTPNRSVTAPLVWMHPEHTAEFTADELRAMFAYAGFEMNKVVGHWLVRKGGAILPLAPDDDRPVELTTAERVSLATHAPGDAFSIWTTSRAQRPAQPDGLRRYVDERWTFANTERSRRSIVHDACAVDGDAFTTDGSEGFKAWGPYIPLKPGRYRALWRLTTEQTAGTIAHVDVACAGGTRIIAERAVDAETMSKRSWADVPLDFELDETLFGVEFRIRAVAGRPWSARRFATIERLADSEPSRDGSPAG